MNLDFFFFFLLHKMLLKCIDSGYLVGATPLQFSTDCFETSQLYSAWNEDMYVICGLYNLCFFCFCFCFFFHFFLLCELSLCF